MEISRFKGGGFAGERSEKFPRDRHLRTWKLRPASGDSLDAKDGVRHLDSLRLSLARSLKGASFACMSAHNRFNDKHPTRKRTCLLLQGSELRMISRWRNCMTSQVGTKFMKAT